jgi:hypothetical protein
LTRRGLLVMGQLVLPSGFLGREALASGVNAGSQNAGKAGSTLPLAVLCASLATRKGAEAATKRKEKKERKKREKEKKRTRGFLKKKDSTMASYYHG